MALRIYAAYDDLLNLYQSYLSADPVTMREFTAGDYLEIEMGLLRRKEERSANAGWEVFPASSFSPSIGIYGLDRAELAFVSSFTEISTSLKRGTLNLNDARLITALGSASELAVKMEVSISTLTGGKQAVFRGDWTIKKPFITPAAAEVVPPDVSATQSWVRNTCMPRDGTDPLNPCDGFYVQSYPSKKTMFVRVRDDRQLEVTEA